MGEFGNGTKRPLTGVINATGKAIMMDSDGGEARDTAKSCTRLMMRRRLDKPLIKELVVFSSKRTFFEGTESAGDGWSTCVAVSA